MPPIELSAADREGMSPAEIEALTSADTDLLLRQIGDTPAAPPTPVAAAAPAEAPAPEPAPSADVNAPAEPPVPAAGAPVAKAPDAPALTAEELAAIAEEADEAPAATERTQFRVDSKDYAAERKALNDKIDAIELKWGEGTMTDAERVKELRTLNDQKDTLLIAQTEARTLDNVNRQTIEQRAMNASVAVLAELKVAQADIYSADADAAAEFDAFHTVLLRNPRNATVAPLELARRADRMVRESRGFPALAAATVPVPAVPAAAPAAAPAPPAGPRDVPVTLSGLPNAAVSEADSAVLDVMAKLEGEDLEDYMARLPRNEVDRIMRIADQTAMTHVHDARKTRANRATPAQAA